MKFIKKHIVIITSFIALILMICGVGFWNHVIKIDKELENKKETEKINLEDINNIKDVEKDLKVARDISVPYLLRYTTLKSNTWYYSKAYVEKITKEKDSYKIVLTNKDKTAKLTTTYDQTPNVKVKDHVYFTGTEDLEDGTINLSNISKKEIDYEEVIQVKFETLVQNIKDIKEATFILHGYIVNKNNTYYLYPDKKSYEKNDKIGNYFEIHFVNKPDFDNKRIKISGHIGDTYVLKDCLEIK